MEILLLLIASFVVWHFIPESDPNRPKPRFRKEPRAVDTDPDWAEFIYQHCESPAETAFLRAMIEAFHLKPSDSSLFGSGLRLDFQVEEGRYRVDFLANQWLVIEIDGAAWHSSPEAIERDKERDAYFESLGYSVLRIPAKVVFNTPSEAVQRVRLAMQKGKRAMPVFEQKSGLTRLSNSLSAIGEGFDRINESVSRTKAVQHAISDAELAAHAQRNAITDAISLAQSELERADFLAAASEETRASYKRSQARLAQTLAEIRSKRPEERQKKLELHVFPVALQPHDNPAYQIEIMHKYTKIVEDRDRFLASQKLVIQSDPRLPSIVEKKLRELGCVEYWALLTSEDNPQPKFYNRRNTKPSQEPIN